MKDVPEQETMTFIVRGVDHKTGEDICLRIEAINKDEALTKSKACGALPTSIVQERNSGQIYELSSEWLAQFIGWSLVITGVIACGTVSLTLCWIVFLGAIFLISYHIGSVDWEERARLEKEKQARIICPHCQEKGFVSTRKVLRNKGLSGSKATGAVLTGGLSLLATGLSRKELETEATCSNCGSVWHY